MTTFLRLPSSRPSARAGSLMALLLLALAPLVPANGSDARLPPVRLFSLRTFGDRTLVRMRVEQLVPTRVHVDLLESYEAENVVGPLLQIAWAARGDSPSEAFEVGDTLWALRPTRKDGGRGAVYGPLEVGREYWVVFRRGERGMGKPFVEHWIPADEKDAAEDGGHDEASESLFEVRPPASLLERMRRSEFHTTIAVLARPLHVAAHLEPPDVAEARAPGAALVVSALGAIGSGARLPIDLAPRAAILIDRNDDPSWDDEGAGERLEEAWFLLSLTPKGSARVLLREDVDSEHVAPLDALGSLRPPPELEHHRAGQNVALVYGEVRAVKEANYASDAPFLYETGEAVEIAVLRVAWENPGVPGTSADPAVEEGHTRRVALRKNAADSLAPALGSLHVGDRRWFVICGSISGSAGLVAALPNEGERR